MGVTKGKLGVTQHQFAFTLAEVLITLSIIGVVAALTIPSLIIKNQEKETVVKLKKTYSVFSNALSLAVIEYGDPSGWNLGGTDNYQGALNITKNMGSFLNITKECGHFSGCFPAGVMYKRIDGSNDKIWDNLVINGTSKGILADGTMFLVWNAGNECNNIRGTSKR